MTDRPRPRAPLETRPAGRARGKLEAALDAFSLAAKVRGARVLDVGAGAGELVQALLERSARAVTAVDAGHGRLRPELARDPRVKQVEDMDFRRMPLRVASGPFDFFSVDVGFAAGRHVLRGLALRLRPGAEGVLSIKPQLELPPRLWGRGGEPPERLRSLAIERVRGKAERLGFVLLDTRDSPVPGRGGTIEVLAHLRFEGKPSPPEAGARAADRARPASRPKPSKPVEEPAATTHRWFAVVTPGGEASAERELRALPGARALHAVAGGVELEGDLDVGFRANLWLRMPTRIVLRLGELTARDFGTLRRRTARLPWDRFLAPSTPIALSVSQRGSRLYHTGAIADSLALALCDALGKDTKIGTDPSAQLVLVRGERDRWTFSLDASGDRLHRRGWRTDTGRASLRETLAALVLALCEWTPEEPLVDGLCGVGTFAIEAATCALGIPPGLLRSFACESWNAAPDDRWASLREAARSDVRSTPPCDIVAVDRDPRAIEAAQRNAARAGCRCAIRFEHASLDAFEPPTTPGLVLLNPPYGRRLGRKRELPGIYRELGRTLRARFPGWRVGVLVPDRALESTLGLRPLARHRLRNGGIPIELIVAQL